MNKYSIEFIDVNKLHFDFKNPRLAEFKLTAGDPEEEILKVLWEAMSVEEIVLSIASSGFFTHEPLIAVEEPLHKKKSLIVIEGNRRLAAVKSILHPEILENYHINYSRISVSTKIKKELTTLPVIKIGNREEAWKYIGFKHINGPAKWGSYAKAQYIAQIHTEFGISLDSIAVQIGDTHKTVQKLYQGLMVVEQAENKKVFDKTDITGARLYFSHLYTALTYEGIREYLGLKDISEEKRNPIPATKLDELGQFLIWLFGSKKRNQEPVIRSQNPDLRRLDSILKNKPATIALKDKAPLIVAYEMSQPGEDVFEQSLVAAKQDLQKAHSFVSLGYKGDLEPLNISDDILNLSQDLNLAMKKKNQEKKTRKA
jgi:hypothetical protein